MTVRTALIALLGVYIVMAFALLALIGHAAGIIWEIPLAPVEIIGGYALGVLIGRAGDLS
jgi:hypothetical protein